MKFRHILVSALIVSAVGIGDSAPASADFSVSVGNPYLNSSKRPIGSVRYDGSCTDSACSWDQKMEVRLNGTWFIVAYSTTTTSPANTTRFTATPPCPAAASGVAADYRTRSNYKVQNNINQTISVSFSGSAGFWFVDTNANANGTWVIVQSTSKTLTFASGTSRLTCRM